MERPNEKNTHKNWEKLNFRNSIGYINRFKDIIKNKKKNVNTSKNDKNKYDCKTVDINHRALNSDENSFSYCDENNEKHLTNIMDYTIYNSPIKKK